MGAATFASVDELLTDRIEALTATAYDQGVAAQWRRSDTPFSVVGDSAPRGHLLFDLWIDRAPNSNLHRDDAAGGVDDEAWLAARVRLQFTYQLRVMSTRADQLAAAGAAVDVIRALVAPLTSAEIDSHGAVLVDLVDGFAQQLSTDGEWLLVTQDYLARFALALTAP